MYRAQNEIKNYFLANEIDIKQQNTVIKFYDINANPKEIQLQISPVEHNLHTLYERTFRWKEWKEEEEEEDDTTIMDYFLKAVKSYV